VIFKHAYLLHLLRIQKGNVTVFLPTLDGQRHVSITAAFRKEFDGKFDFDFSKPALMYIPKDRNEEGSTEFSVTITLGLGQNEHIVGFRPSYDDVCSELISFFADRLKVQLRDQGARHDLVDAVFALDGQDDLLLIVRRVEALGKFLDIEDGKNLLAGYKRATNIIRIEEKKDSREYTGAPDAKLYDQPEEKALAQAIDAAKTDAKRAVEKEDFEAAMRAMAKLRPSVDAFFDKVTVNVEDKALRENRLKLLNEIRAATRAVADFSRIEG